MSASFYLLLTSGVLLAVSLLVLWGSLRWGSHGGIHWTAESAEWRRERDGLALEIGERIFDSADWEMVRREATPRLARRFRKERTFLALEWLRLVRNQVRHLVREYRRAARVDESVSAAGELGMAIQILLFELTTGLLWCLIAIHGPSGAAKLLGWSLDSARKLRRITGEAASDAFAGAAGIVKTNS
jgi:hypothetical protein